MSQKISGVKGMNDILPPDSRIWSRVESAAREVLDRFGYEEIRFELDGRGGSLKSQMKQADKSMARFVLVLGENELNTRSAQLKPLRGGEPRNVSLDTLPAALRAS